MDATESADMYAATRARVTETAQALTAEQLNTRVPACPDWTVHNLISHLAGVAGDFVAGNLDGAPRPPWTAVQVKARQDLPVDAILAEWAETGPTLKKLIRTGTTTHPLVCHPYVDAGIHEADLRGAIGTGRPPREIWLAALDWMLPDPRPSDEAPGTLSIITPDGTYQLGSGEPSQIESWHGLPTRVPGRPPYPASRSALILSTTELPCGQGGFEGRRLVLSLA